MPAEGTTQALPGEVAELVGELSETASPSRRRKLTGAVTRLARRSGRATRYGVLSGGRWLTAQVLAMAPRLPVRDQQTLRAQFPGLSPEELADMLIQGSTRASAAIGAAAGAAMVLPLPAAPVEVAVETLALVGIEIKLVAELHEVYGMRASGSATERMLSYVTAWAHRRGVSFALRSCQPGPGEFFRSRTGALLFPILGEVADRAICCEFARQHLVGQSSCSQYAGYQNHRERTEQLAHQHVSHHALSESGRRNRGDISGGGPLAESDCGPDGRC